jgi:hypothetical protein
MNEIDPIRGDPLAAGQDAMERAAWDEARACFEAALAEPRRRGRPRHRP